MAPSEESFPASFRINKLREKNQGTSSHGFDEGKGEGNEG